MEGKTKVQVLGVFAMALILVMLIGVMVLKHQYHEYTERFPMDYIVHVNVSVYNGSVYN